MQPQALVLSLHWLIPVLAVCVYNTPILLRSLQAAAATRAQAVEQRVQVLIREKEAVDQRVQVLQREKDVAAREKEESEQRATKLTAELVCVYVCVCIDMAALPSLGIGCVFCTNFFTVLFLNIPAVHLLAYCARYLSGSSHTPLAYEAKEMFSVSI